MYFLCPSHRSKLISLSNDQLSSYWLDWMLQAGNLYEQANWDKAIAFAGSALDLTSSASLRPDIDLTTEATLAAIYTINMLNHQQQYQKAADLAGVIGQRLMEAVALSERNEIEESLLTVINDARKHYSFFTEYMSLPFDDVDSTSVFYA